MEFASIMKYARSLRFEERPDYNYIKRLFDSIFYRAGYGDVGYDWKNLNKPRQQRELKMSEKMFLKDEMRTRRKEDQHGEEAYESEEEEESGDDDELSEGDGEEEEGEAHS
jgi:casein kinase 1